MHPDILQAALSRSQWLEWMTWMAIRGPIGPQRADFHASLVAMHAGKPYDKPPSFSDFAMPWAPPDPENDDE